MVYLAAKPADSHSSVTELSRATDAPQAFLTKVLQRLAVAGLIVSHRGPAGGFQLKTAAGAISLLDVVEAVEGPLQLNLCTGMDGGAPVCSRENWCATHVIWQHAQSRLREILAAESLEKLANASTCPVASAGDIALTGN